MGRGSGFCESQSCWGAQGCRAEVSRLAHEGIPNTCFGIESESRFATVAMVPGINGSMHLPLAGVAL